MNINEISIEDIRLIRPLWERLNAWHLQNSRSFKAHYAAQTFDARCAKFFELPKSAVHIDMLTNETGDAKGYCICTTSGETGEIDSLYITPEMRTKGFGRTLIQNGLDWLEAQGCNRIYVSVADGNEHVFPFYERFGFAVRKTVMEIQKNKK